MVNQNGTPLEIAFSEKDTPSPTMGSAPLLLCSLYAFHMSWYAPWWPILNPQIKHRTQNNTANIGHNICSYLTGYLKATIVYGDPIPKHSINISSIVHLLHTVSIYELYQCSVFQLTPNTFANTQVARGTKRCLSICRMMFLVSWCHSIEFTTAKKWSSSM